MDYISIKNLETYAYHGVYKEEQENGQHFYINARLYLSTRRAGLSDLLEESVSYAEVCEFINDYMTSHIHKLLETVAECLALEILLNFPLIERICIEVCKPEAPIGLPFENVSVTIERGWHKAYISFGSNMGERESCILEAIEKIRNDKSCKVIRISKYYETKPYGGVEQENFLNGAMEIDTLFSPDELLAFLNQIEADAGRVREVRWGPRTLDLDIVFYDDIILDSKNLVIPHADMHNRLFVLEPLAEIASNLRHPLNQKTISQMMEEVKNTV